MIKVAHVTTVDISLRYLLLNQIKFIQSKGYEVVGVSAPGAELPALKVAGIAHIPVPFARSSSLTPFSDLKAFFRLIQLFQKEKFKIVHTHTAKPDLYASIAARLAGVPIVITTLHGFYFHDLMPSHWRRFFMTMARLGGRFADLVLSQNPEDIEVNRKEKVYPEQKLKFLGNGIDVERFDRSHLADTSLQTRRKELGLPDNVPVVGFVGRLVKEKGILELMAAAQIVQQQIPDAHFLIVGPVDKDKADAITPEIARQYGVGSACIFAGMRHDMPEIYALMDVFVLPSHREAFPRVIMEASAMGVPCVVTDVRGCRAAVTHDRNGLLVPLGDVTALAEAIMYLLKNHEVAHQMAAEGRRTALARFDERQIFATVLAEYARLLQEKGIVVSSPASI